MDVLTKTGRLVEGGNDGIDGIRLVVGDAESEGALETVVEIGCPVEAETVGEIGCPVEAEAVVGGICQTHLLWTTK